jgi:hypothetical protein
VIQQFFRMAAFGPMEPMTPIDCSAILDLAPGISAAISLKIF